MKIQENKKIEIIEIIKKRLPPKSKILILSLTGSRAGGYANEHSDYDIVGIFAAKKYWDSAQVFENGFDINLYQFKNPIDYQGFDFFADISNPFYLHPKFDFREFLKFCTIETVKKYRVDFLRRIRDFEIEKSARSALHAYRGLMTPIYFLKKKKIELNIFKINQTYKFEQLKKLKITYIKLHNQGAQIWDEDMIRRDLTQLLNEYNNLCQRKKGVSHIQEAQKWYEKEIKKFY